MTQYPGYGGDISFADDILDAIVYDFITDGNAKTLQLVNGWFDSEGQFVAFPTLFRTRVLFHAQRVRNHMENIIQQDAPDPGTYSNQPTYTDRELRATEYSVHKLNQLFHLIFVALERSTFPTLYLKQTFDAGVAVNTSGNYISAAGHPFEAYDRVKYASLGTAIAELDREVYWIHPNTTADRIYLAEYIDGEVRELTAGTPSQIHTLEVERDAGVDRVPITYGFREIPTPVNSGMDLADVIYGATTGAYAEIVRVEDNLAEIMYQVKYLALNNFSAANVGGLSFRMARLLWLGCYAILVRSLQQTTQLTSRCSHLKEHLPLVIPLKV